MSIRHRITLLVVLTFLAIAAIGGYAVFRSRDGASEVKAVTEGVVPSALASADLVSQLKDVQLAAMILASAPDSNILAQAKQKLTEKKSLLLAALDLQSKSASGDAQKGLVDQARESASNYFQAIDETVSLKLAGKSDLAQANLFGNVVQYQGEMEVIVETLRIEKNRVKDSAIAMLNENLSTTTTAVTVITSIAGLLLAAIGALLYRQITGPIGRMQKMMSEIAASQDFTRRVPVGRMDEIGHSVVAFNGMIEKIQESSSQLKQKSADIQAMLKNMQQGILTVVDGMKIHPEYSAYVESIFETGDIPGRDVMDLVFRDARIEPDVLAQVDAAGRACIGEDVMNFEFNQHLLVGEIERKMPDGRVKILDLDWSPIVDDTGTTVRLMLCIRDVTELRVLAAETSEQKRTLEIIGEILAVSQEKFHEFIASAMTFVTESELIIRQHREPHAESVAGLFRNMHTIKGNARTYGLRHLSNIVHGAEQTYEELRKPHPQVAWDRSRLMEELAAVKDAIDRYAKINEQSLGRKGPGQRGGVDRYLMVDKAHIQESLHRLETVNTANLQDLVSARDAVRKTLRLLGTEAIGETLSSVLNSMPSLAKELGKAPPMISIEDNGLVVTGQASGMLKNVFMHLIRNAMDHGLETPDVRSAQGKPPSGTIRIELGVVDAMLQITVGDDGRGLALGRIRDMAIARSFIGGGDKPEDEELADLIFRAGFSTVESITEISGRGVGMDAVREFLKREKGKIEIHFTDDAVGADFRQFKTVVSLPGVFAVSAKDSDHAVHASDRHVVEEARARPSSAAVGHARLPDAPHGEAVNFQTA